LIVGFTGDRCIVSTDIPKLHRIIDQAIEDHNPTEIYLRLEGYIDIEIIKYLHKARNDIPTTLFCTVPIDFLKFEFREACFLPHKVVFVRSKICKGSINQLIVNEHFFRNCKYEYLIWTGVEEGWYQQHLVKLELYEKDFKVVPLTVCLVNAKSISKASIKTRMRVVRRVRSS